jgi:hypothetical protein
MANLRTSNRQSEPPATRQTTRATRSRSHDPPSSAPVQHSERATRRSARQASVESTGSASGRTRATRGKGGRKAKDGKHSLLSFDSNRHVFGFHPLTCYRPLHRRGSRSRPDSRAARSTCSTPPISRRLLQHFTSDNSLLLTLCSRCEGS